MALRALCWARAVKPDDPLEDEQAPDDGARDGPRAVRTSTPRSRTQTSGDHDEAHYRSLRRSHQAALNCRRARRTTSPAMVRASARYVTVSVFSKSQVRHFNSFSLT